MKTIHIHSIDDTKEFAKKLAELIKPHFLITLQGDLGAGKTTFTKFLGEQLGVKKTINSPTFTILKSYQGRMPLYHIDAYRLEGIDQDLGFEEVFDDEGLCVVEWSNFIEEQLPQERLEITIKRISEEGREFGLVAKGKRYDKILEEL